MPDTSLVFTLLAKGDFETGDLGWATLRGVVHPCDFRPSADIGSFVVRAIEPVKANTHGRFHEPPGPAIDAPNVRQPSN